MYFLRRAHAYIIADVRLKMPLNDCQIMQTAPGTGEVSPPSRDVSPVNRRGMSLFRKSPRVLCLSVTSALKCLLCRRSASSSSCPSAVKTHTFHAHIQISIQTKLAEKNPPKNKLPLVGAASCALVYKLTLFCPFIACRENDASDSSRRYLE